MKPSLRYKLLKYSLIVFSSVRLCIGIIMVVLAIDHIRHPTNYASVDFENEAENVTTEADDVSQSTFDVLMNGTEKQAPNPIHPNEALFASVTVIILSLIGLVGLLKNHIVLVLIYGLLCVSFLILRIHVLVRTILGNSCGLCVRDECLNTVLGIFEIIMIFRLAYELRLKRGRNSAAEHENAFPELRTSVPTLMNITDAEDKNLTNSEDLESSQAIKLQGAVFTLKFDPVDDQRIGKTTAQLRVS